MTTSTRSDPLPAEAGQPRRRGTLIPEGLLGEIRRTAVNARRHIHHSHPDGEFNLVIRGSGAVTLDDHAYELRPGTLMWIVPNKVHRLTRGPNLEMWVVAFRPHLLEPAWLEDLAAQPLRTVSSDELLGLDRLFADIAQDSDEPAAYNPGIEYAVMRALRASRDRPAAALKPMHPAVARAVSILRQSNSGESLSALAAAAGVAPHYLSHLLTIHTGRGFLDWRNRIRLDRFMEIYRPGANLLNTALEAGFGSYTRFHSTFTDLVGCAPKEWVARVEAAKIVPRANASAPAAGFGLHGRSLLSARQRWAALLPMVSPAIRAFAGEAFADRLLSALPLDPGPAWAHLEDLDHCPSAGDLERLVESLRQQDPDVADEYGRLLATCDVRSIYEQTCSNIGIDTGGLTHAFAVLLCVIWCVLKPEQLTAPQHAAARRQVHGALGAHPRHDADVLREAHVAMLCHFVVVRQAAVAARASGDMRLREQVAKLVADWSVDALGGDLRAHDLTAEGFVRPTPQPAMKAKLRDDAWADALISGSLANGGQSSSRPLSI